MLKFDQYFSRFEDSDSLFIFGPLDFNQTIQEKEPIIYVDGGANHRDKDKIGISIGDGDSYKGQLDISLCKRKNYSDLSYVLEHIPSHIKEIFLYGFLGGRKDHELINLGEVYSYLLACEKQTKVYFDDQIVIYSAGKWTFSHKGLFSLFSFKECLVEIGGSCEYPYLGKLKALSSHGLSNIGDGEITLTTSMPIVVFLNSCFEN